MQYNMVEWEKMEYFSKLRRAGGNYPISQPRWQQMNKQTVATSKLCGSTEYCAIYHWKSKFHVFLCFFLKLMIPLDVYNLSVFLC